MTLNPPRISPFPRVAKRLARLLSQVALLLSFPRVGYFNQKTKKRSQHMTWNPERRPNNIEEEAPRSLSGPLSRNGLYSKQRFRRRAMPARGGHSRGKEGVHKKPTHERLYDAVTVTQCYARLFARCPAGRIFMTTRQR